MIAGYNAEYKNKANDGGYVNSQTATAMAVTLDAAEDNTKSTAWLVASLGADNNHSKCGEIGWPYVAIRLYIPFRLFAGSDQCCRAQMLKWHRVDQRLIVCNRNPFTDTTMTVTSTTHSPALTCYCPHLF